MLGPTKYATQWDYENSKRSTITFTFENTHGKHDKDSVYECESVKINFFVASVEFNLKTLALKKVYDMMIPHAREEYSSSKRKLASKMVSNGHLNSEDMTKLTNKTNDILVEMMEKEYFKLIPQEKMTASIIKASDFWQIHMCVGRCKKAISPKFKLLTKYEDKYIDSKRWFGRRRLKAKFCNKYHCICLECIKYQKLERCPECYGEFQVHPDEKKLIVKINFIYESKITVFDSWTVTAMPGDEHFIGNNINGSIPQNLCKQMYIFHNVQSMIYSKYKDDEKETIENINDGIWSHYRSSSTLKHRTTNGRTRDTNQRVSVTRLQYRRYENSMALLTHLLKKLSLTQRRNYYTIIEEQVKDHLPLRNQTDIRRIELLDYVTMPGLDSNTDSDGEMATSNGKIRFNIK